jgi:division protein CdvB (Snf7/Vps24/ESCRT-III family)
MRPDEQTEPSDARALATANNIQAGPNKIQAGRNKIQVRRRKIQAKRNKIQISNRLASCDKMDVFQLVMTSASLDAYVSFRPLQIRGGDPTTGRRYSTDF